METKTAYSQEVLLDDGVKKELKEFWQDQPIVLVFLRHFG